MTCCNEAGCTRLKPMILSRGGLSGAWFVVTEYDQDDDGRIVSTQKHQLTERQSDHLTQAFDIGRVS